MKLAFEYNGKFHYEKVFENQDLEQQKKNDIKKAKLSNENGIKLIQVKYFPIESTIDRFKYIEEILNENNVVFPPNYTKDISLPNIYYDNYYEEIKQIVEKKGGRLQSLQILDATTNIDIICEKGHLFHMTPHKLKSGQWCKHNMINRRLSDEEVKLTIEHYGGTYIQSYKNGKEFFVEYLCDEGHFQKKSVHRVRDGRWCNCEEHKGRTKRNPYTRRFDYFEK